MPATESPHTVEESGKCSREHKQFRWHLELLQMYHKWSSKQTNTLLVTVCLSKTMFSYVQAHGGGAAARYTYPGPWRTKLVRESCLVC